MDLLRIARGPRWPGRLAAGLLWTALALAGCNVGQIDTRRDSGEPDCAVSLTAVGSTDLSLAAYEQVQLQVLLGDDCDGPLAGGVIQFAIDGPDLGAQLSAAQVQTDPAGTASVTLSATGLTGQLTVVASHAVSNAEVTFSVEVTQAPCQDHCWNGVQDCGETGLDCGGECEDCDYPCEGHCSNGILDCEETEVDCGGGGCEDCADPCAGHCANGAQDCGEAGLDCGGECVACADPCDGHCSNGITDCGETEVDCGGGGCPACPDPCDGHCSNGITDCGEAEVDCGGGGCPACPDPCDGHCHSGVQDCGETGRDCGGECSACNQTGCTFPQGVPDGDYTHGDDTDGSIAAAVNAVMADLSGCSVGSDCVLAPAYPVAQNWFDAVNQALRDQGYCAGQHVLGHTDEIAVSNTGCTGRWYGYHIYNYGGGKVVWNPGAQRGWWAIEPGWCP